MLAIRLSRVGKKNSAYFRVVVMDKQKSAKGRALEVLGSVNPHKNEIVLKNERILHWIGVGAQPSDRVHNILITQGVIKGDKIAKKIRKAKKAEGEATKEAPKETPKEIVKEAAPEEPKAEESKVEETKTEEAKPEEKPAEKKPAEEPKEEVKKEKPKAEFKEVKPEKAAELKEEK